MGVKGELTMSYFTRNDIPFHRALASAFTVCDNYFCSVQGPTTPNRLYLWSGMIDPNGTAGGPAYFNPADYKPVYDWTTYPERLQAAGISWQVYANDEVGDGGRRIRRRLRGQPALAVPGLSRLARLHRSRRCSQLAERASVRAQWKPDSGLGKNVDHVLAQFIADCQAGSLPAVSWVVAPYAYCEHPQARPVDGAAYTAGVLKALWDNPELWSKTAVFIDFDENDGFFDHVRCRRPRRPARRTEYILGPADRARPAGADDRHLAVEPRRLRELAGLRPHLGDPVPGGVDGRPRAEHLGLAPQDLRRPDQRVRLRPAQHEHSDAARHHGAAPAGRPDPDQVAAAGATGGRTPDRRGAGTRYRAGPADAVPADARTSRPGPNEIELELANFGAAALQLSVYAYHLSTVPPSRHDLDPGQSIRTELPTVLGGYDIAIHGPNGFMRTAKGNLHTAGVQAALALQPRPAEPDRAQRRPPGGAAADQRAGRFVLARRPATASWTSGPTTTGTT